MPGVVPSSDNFAPLLLQQFDRRLQAVERQQNSGVVDLVGNYRLRWGVLPDGTYSFQVFDAEENLRVTLGQHANGDFGLAYYSLANDGTFEELYPTESAYYESSSPIEATSTAYSTGAGSPEVTAYLGASGDAIVTAGAYIATSQSNQTGTLGLSIDGLPASDIASLGAGGTSLNANVSSARRLSQWVGVQSSGRHTFTLQQKTSTAGVPTTFGALSLLVQPI